MLPLSDLIQGLDLGGGESHGDDLHRLGTAAGPAPAATLQRLDVESALCLMRPFLDLLLRHHAEIV